MGMLKQKLFVKCRLVHKTIASLLGSLGFLLCGGLTQST